MDVQYVLRRISTSLGAGWYCGATRERGAGSLSEPSSLNAQGEYFSITLTRPPSDTGDKGASLPAPLPLPATSVCIWRSEEARKAMPDEEPSSTSD